VYRACQISRFATRKSNADVLYVRPIVHLPLINTPSKSPPQSPLNEDAMMASEPTLSSLAQLAESASANDISSVPLDSTSPANKTKEQQRRYYIRMLHRVIDEADVILLVLDARDPAGCRSRLVEEEVRRREAEGKRLVFVLNKIGA
jgi:nuclear GTP-binding protein